MLQQQLPSSFIHVLGRSSTTTALAAAVSAAAAMSNNNNSTSPAGALFLAPRPSAILWMASSMACHFGGYEFARSSNLALFTSPTTGFQSPAAFPLAMACVSPLSLVLLWLYGKELHHYGPKIALRKSILGTMAIMSLTAVLMGGINPTTSISISILRQALVGFAFCFQNSYAHLLYTQHWSFMGSIMDPIEGSRWFASIAGLSSVASMITGSLVGPFVHHVGLYGLLIGTVICLGLSLGCSERAYHLAETNGFDPSLERQTTSNNTNNIHDNNNNNNNNNKSHRSNPAQMATKLFQNQPTLKALFMEVLTFQSLCTILNICLVTKVKTDIVNDRNRAAWTGKLYASISGVSGVAQFLLLPLVMKWMEPKWVWRWMPILPVVCTIVTCIQHDPSLWVLAAAFGSAKVMDYSLRGVVNEMVYVPLDFESRFMGKEIIGVFGNRFGKSGMSLFLSGLTFYYGGGGTMASLTKISSVASLLWMSFAWRLSDCIPSKEEGQRIVDQRRKQQQNGMTTTLETKEN